MKLHYHLVDVFTGCAFGGNPLAVFPDGGVVPEAAMQSIARELNLSETTFVLSPQNKENDFHVRIFTPAGELPMAGHPTIGTAFVLAREKLIRAKAGTTAVRFEEGVGVIPVSITAADSGLAFIEMNQPLPEFGPEIDDLESVAAMLSLDSELISATRLPVQTVSCGLPFVIVPLPSLSSVREIRFRADICERIRAQIGTDNVFVFTRETELPGSHVHSRMFAPVLGLAEDPATGSASGPLGCYLVRHHVIESDAELRCISEQGIEMGRPSLIRIRIEHFGDQITAVAVGGTCHYMGAGYLDL